MDREILHTLALTFAEGIGDITGRKIISYFGSAEAAFAEKPSRLSSIPGSSVLINAIKDSSLLKRAEKEIEFSRKAGIEITSWFQSDYPGRLKECPDAPLVLFRRGDCNLDQARVIAIVGTRKATHYGIKITEELISDLARLNVVIVSGLALGIDICAHKASMEKNLSTVAVLAHGLDRIYPGNHRAYAKQILEQRGVLVSDFPSGTNPDKENFPKRNRIIAGLSDAVIVIEARERGGALITADIANSYNREVMAFPGSVHDSSSAGCNNLIRKNQALLVTNAVDVVKALGWEDVKNELKPIQQKLFVQLSADEEVLVNIIKETDSADIDRICHQSGFNTGKIAALLLNLELSGVIKALPGKIYRLN